jgi:hypothetical protein
MGMKAMLGVVIFLISLRAFAGDFGDSVETKEGYQSLEDISQQLQVCADTSKADYDELFSFALDGENTGVDSEETVSGANDKVFRACPKNFLVALMQKKPDEINRILKVYFGVEAQPWDLASQMCALQEDRQVGAFVREQFLNLIKTFADKSCKPVMPADSRGLDKRP